MKHILLGGACGFSLLAAPGLAHAQASDPGAIDATDVSDPGETGGPVEGGADENVIIVTAQGRQQQLADVPVAISAINAETLKNSGANDIRELNQIAPSLLVSSTGNEANGSARVRGIGTVGDNPGLESSVAVFVDGVYRSRSGAGLNEIQPIERVEVLRGPQGTLFGRNASAGLINVVTQSPTFRPEGYVAASYGNYDAIRVEGGISGGLSDTIAARIDGVYFERDGFYDDVVNNVTINNRDRWLVRGQMLFEPSDTLRFRFIGDYSKKEEACCASEYLTRDDAAFARQSLTGDQFDRNPQGPGLTELSNPVIPILIGLGQNPTAFEPGIQRELYVTPGRSYEGETEDWGVSLQADWELGDASLTSITAYRKYGNNQASDTDYSQVDILFRAPGKDALGRYFETFSQELRLQGTAFDDRLDWLIGGYYANEDLTVRDNLKFGTQYGEFVTCRVALSLAPAALSPGDPGCLAPAVFGGLQATSAFGPATPLLIDGILRLQGLGSVGDEDSAFFQNSENFAFFTHNIFHITDRLDLTLGLRYTNETKTLAADLNNTNTICPDQRAALSPLLGTAAGSLAAPLIVLACQGNSSSEVNGLNLGDERSEDAFTGTAVLSYKATDDLLIYGSYSRGYKAGGFNLDRSALNNPLFSPITAGTSANLQFEQEEVDAFEIGLKYSSYPFSISLAAFRQEFTNFQLNTFNGAVYVVQNVNSCANDLGGADLDDDATTGSCAVDDVQPGVISEGIEIESTLNPGGDLSLNLGLTYADTRYEDNLIGDDSGLPLDPALQLLPGQNLSNAPKLSVTSSLSWTPPLGNGGLSGLFYINQRTSSSYNTGSDLLPAKRQESFTLVNARIGIRGPDQRWAVELWGQNLFDIGYTQVAFNAPFQAPQQIYGAFLAEPRTYGLTVRAGF